MKSNISIKDWQLSWIENAFVVKNKICIKTPKDIKDRKYPTIKANVPGNFELDFMREGLLEDVYMGVNSVKTHKLENLHLYYFTEFVYESKSGCDSVLCFEGVDTAAEIYLDGELLGFVENMLHAHRFDINGLKNGKHTILVHILPSAIYARQFDVSAMCFGLKYNHDGIQMRKAGSMFGWDIMPRIVSGGLWKPVTIEYLPKSRICDAFTYTENYDEKSNTAMLITTFKIHTDEDYISDFRIVITGKCGESSFYKEVRPYNASNRIWIQVEDPELWWPKNYGKQPLYDIEIRLLKDGVEYDRVNYRIGIRRIWLKRTSRSGEDGEFCFIANGKKIFVMGTNWVPCDAFPSRHDAYTLRNIHLADEQGCNMIRCWGGNVYPSDVLYDYCDEHGIMIWQDFSFACGHYPDDERLCALVKEEVKQVVIDKRNHPALVIWAGDNECDNSVVSYCTREHTDDEPLAMLDPNYNKLTRDTILRELRNHDATRPYLPSSPYIDSIAYRYGKPAENHLWGPRDFFKGEFYSTADCHFASEIGYHGCPSPESIKKFIPIESMPKRSIYDICENADWLVHASGMEMQVEENPYAYRLPLMIGQVERLFGTVANELDEFARQSQVSQAEAVKFFIERFRCQKWRKTGILWWNIADGWPQVSDAVVDWYGVKKLAYHYIMRSQKPVCLICDEPKEGVLDLLAVNDTQSMVKGEYTVVELVSEEKVASGAFEVDPNGKTVVCKLPEKRNGFYLIRWTSTGGNGVNHFVCKIGDGWTWEAYKTCMRKAGFYSEFEGF